MSAVYSCCRWHINNNNNDNDAICGNGNDAQVHSSHLHANANPLEHRFQKLPKHRTHQSIMVSMDRLIGQWTRHNSDGSNPNDKLLVAAHKSNDASASLEKMSSNAADILNFTRMFSTNRGLQDHF